MEKIDLNNLSPEQKKALMTQLKEEKKKEKEKMIGDREALFDLQDEVIPKVLEEIREYNQQLIGLKTKIYEAVGTIIALRRQVYPNKAKNREHTLSTRDYSASLKIGYRVTDGYDDSVFEGVAMVHEAVNRRTDIPEDVMDFMHKAFKQDSKGNYQPSRIAEFKQSIVKFKNSEEILEGIELIEQAYRPKRSAYYIEGQEKDSIGRETHYPLSISAVDFMPGKEDIGSKLFNI